MDCHFLRCQTTIFLFAMCYHYYSSTHYIASVRVRLLLLFDSPRSHMNTHRHTNAAWYTRADLEPICHHHHQRRQLWALVYLYLYLFNSAELALLLCHSLCDFVQSNVFAFSLSLSLTSISLMLASSSVIAYRLRSVLISPPIYLFAMRVRKMLSLSNQFNDSGSIIFSFVLSSEYIYIIHASIYVLYTIIYIYSRNNNNIIIMHARARLYVCVCTPGNRILKASVPQHDIYYIYIFIYRALCSAWLRVRENHIERTKIRMIMIIMMMISILALYIYTTHT